MKNSFFKHTILFFTSISCINISFAQKEIKKSSSYSTYSTNNKSSYLNVNESGDGANMETLINYRDHAERYTIKMVGDKVTELYVDDKKIPAENFNLYSKVIDKIKEQVKKDKAQAEEDRKQAEKDRAQAQVDRLQAEKDRQQAVLDRAQADKDRQQAMRDREQMMKDKQQADKHREQAQKDRQQAEKDRQQANEDRKQAEKDRAQAQLDRKQAEEDRALVKSMITELVKDGIISDEKELGNLVLSADEFTVNGKKLSAAQHNSYKTKYLSKPGTHMTIGSNSTGTFIDVNKND